MKEWVQEIRVVEESSETMGSGNKGSRGKQSNNGFMK